MGLAAGLRIFPVVIISLYAGVMIDRIGGKRVLIFERMILIVLAIVTGAILLFDHVEIWHIIVLATLAGLTIAMSEPATETLVPEVAPEELLQPANSINQLGHALGRTLGPLAAGILIAIKSAALALFGLAVVYAVAMIATFGIKTKPKPLVETESESTTRQIVDGLQYVLRAPILRWTILMALCVIFFAMLLPIIPVYAREVLEVGEVKFGWMWGLRGDWPGNRRSDHCVTRRLQETLTRSGSRSVRFRLGNDRVWTFRDLLDKPYFLSNCRSRVSIVDNVGRNTVAEPLGNRISRSSDGCIHHRYARNVDRMDAGRSVARRIR
jgi:hypothetical protein